ncbi:b2bc3daa-13f2-4416-83ac-da260a31d989 [Thermothielavioides terrestris]|uniref:B2bc3daa-13f2-4416-83ac-da260a31d989 n=1 Tax=Thermothielavioides terrestris TaxID=2587410 RepID=A0A446BDM5_9PEZI|nr:b2bc3daa-13f2-4416-83ac-da260a31d989 [Thermothielavioides terrestris]
MPPIERDAPRELDRALKHRHSASVDHGRALVPMWDSSDPERAPPPLPLNPQSPVVSRAGTSTTIQSAHAAMAEKARESALVPQLAKRIDTLPERPALRNSTATHRRMQSVQPASVKDISLMIEAGGRDSPQSAPRSPEKPERPKTPQRRDTPAPAESREDKQERSTAGTPTPGPSLTPIIRPTSATMLALQNMSTQSSSSTPAAKEPETPLANITNGAKALVKVPESLESLSSQIMTLTDIATTLQKEMTLLSRRSRDNATDLLSLKEATNARDEDIRKSLRELINDSKSRHSAPRDPYGGPLLLESGRHHPSSPTQLSKTARPFSLPRIPSPNSFTGSLDRESSLSTPSLISDAPSPATVALLEKIIREMGTKEGQDALLQRLTELADKLCGMATAEKVEELARFVKSNQQQAVVPAAGAGRGGSGGGGGIRDRSWGFDDDNDRSRRGALDFPQAANSAPHTSRLLPGQDGSQSSAAAPRAADVLNDDVLKAIRTVKDSVAQGGGLTAEVKALVRELRGEVLGMGREIGRRLDEVADKSTGKPEAVTKAAMTEVIEQGLSEMSQQMNSILREHRRQSAATLASRESSVDYKEIYNSVRAALKDAQATKPRTPELRREDVIQAVKDAWEKYKPEIEIQQIGLERDEVLACLQEGLRAYAPRDDRPVGATRDEVFQAVVEGMKHYVPPKVEIPASLSRDEVLEAVRECLEEFEFPVAPSAMGAEITREDMLDAVKEGLQSFDFPTPPPPPPPPPGSDLTRDDVLDAVNEGLQAFDFSSIYSNALVPQSVSKGDVQDAVKSGLKSLDLSSDILDAVKDGLDAVDLPTNVAQAVRQALQTFDFSAACASVVIPRPDLSRVDVADAVKEGIECLDLTNSVTRAVKQALQGFDPTSAFASALVPRSDISRVDVADAVREGLQSFDVSKGVTEAVRKALEAFDLSSLSSALVARPDLSRVDVVEAVKEGFDTAHLSKDVADAVKRALETFDFSASLPAPVAHSDLSRNDVLEAVKEGLGSLDLSASVGDVVKKELQSFDISAAQSTALVARSGNDDEVLQRLHEIKDLLQAEIKAASQKAQDGIAASARDTEQILDATKDGFEKLRQDIEGYVDRAKGEVDPEQVMDQILRNLDSFRDELAQLVTRSSDSSRAMLKEEIESLRDAVNSSLIPALPQPGNNKEILEALHDGLHALRSEISTRPIAGLTEILDTLQEGLGDIRTSINNLRDKPADLTANDEILDALKEGLDSVRTDIDNLREETKNDRALATINDSANAVVPAEQALKHEDIKNLELLIAQLGIKVEALESAPKPAVTPLSKADLADMEETLRNVADSVAGIPNREPFESLEESLRKIQDTVAELSAREQAAPPPPSSTDPASREDVEAIETILRNTKARLDDLMDGEQAVRKEHIDTLETLILEARENLAGLSSHVDGISRKEHIDALETLILETREALGGLASQVEILSRKEDVAMVESLVTQVIAAFDEMKERHEKALEDPEKVTKTDVEAVEAICLDTKSLIEHIQKVDLASLPSKEDIEGLETRLGDVKERLDTYADASTKAFEERQAEIVGVGVSVTELKATLEEFRALMRSKLEDGARGIDSIHAILDALTDSVRKNENIGDDVKEVLDTIKLESEDTKTGMVGVKIELEEKLQVAADTLLAKLDERMAELMTKHEELKLLQDDQAAKGEARDLGLEAAVNGTKAVAEELKSLVDTLGAAVTDSMEKMEEASKTVFERVEDLVNKSDENHTDAKAEHQLTREQVQEAIGKVDGLQGQVSEYQPKILETVQELTVLLAQHYEHLKASTLAIQERVEHPLLPPPPEKYDDTAVIERLDKLVGHTEVADRAFGQLETLDKVHAQVKATAAELAAFLAAQTQRIADEHEDREKTLQETTIALERRREEKEQLEAHIASLREEEARLKEAITVTLPEEQSKINEQFLANLQAEEARIKEATATLLEEQAQLKETFLAVLKEEQARLLETNVTLKEEQDKMKETFLANLKEEQARLMETNVALKEEHDKLKETFLTNLKEEQARLMETNVALKEEHDKLKETFFANLRDEESRLKEMNDALRDEQQVLKDTFLANLREEESLLKEVNAGLREEQERLKETFLANLKEEEQRLRATNDALRQEQEQIKATLKEEQEQIKAALREEESLLKEVNAGLQEEQERLKETFLVNLKEEEQRLRATNDALRQEQEQIKATLKEEQEQIKAALKEEQEQVKAALKEEQERFKIELLANLIEEEARLKEANASLREEQEQMRISFLATLQEEESRLKDSLRSLRAEQDNLGRQKSRLVADLSSLDTALRLRREELHDMEARAESLERRILEGVIDHSRVLLMAKTNRAAAAANSGRDPMSRKRVSSSAHKSAAETAAATTAASDHAMSKPRSAINLAMSARSRANNTPNGGTHSSASPSSSSSSSRRILSLSQITNNIPSGGMKRSQSVRTAGGAAGARGLRKSSWAPPPAAASLKGYGDLGGSSSGSGLGDDKENLDVDLGLDLRERDEDAYHEREREVAGDDNAVPPPPAPVEIVVSDAAESAADSPAPPSDVDGAGASPAAGDEARPSDFDEALADEVNEGQGGEHGAEEDRFSEFGEREVEGEEEEARDDDDNGAGDGDDARSLRRASHGTTVITPAADDGEQREEEWSEHEGGEPEEGAGEMDDAASDWTENEVGRESDVGLAEREGSVPVAAAS